MSTERAGKLLALARKLLATNGEELPLAPEVVDAFTEDFAQAYDILREFHKNVLSAAKSPEFGPTEDFRTLVDASARIMQDMDVITDTLARMR